MIMNSGAVQNNDDEEDEENLLDDLELFTWDDVVEPSLLCAQCDGPIKENEMPYNEVKQLALDCQEVIQRAHTEKRMLHAQNQALRDEIERLEGRIHNGEISAMGKDHKSALDQLRATIAALQEENALLRKNETTLKTMVNVEQKKHGSTQRQRGDGSNDEVARLKMVIHTLRGRLEHQARVAHEK